MPAHSALNDKAFFAKRFAIFNKMGCHFFVGYFLFKKNSRKYGENLRNFILQVRKDFSVPEMFFVYGEVMPMAAERFPGRNIVREAQVNVSEGACSPISVKNSILIEGDDLQMVRSDYKSPIPQDDVHLGTYGILTLGERFAKAIYENSRSW